jgi:hypothetical protein
MKPMTNHHYQWIIKDENPPGTPSQQDVIVEFEEDGSYDIVIRLADSTESIVFTPEEALSLIRALGDATQVVRCGR